MREINFKNTAGLSALPPSRRWNYPKWDSIYSPHCKIDVILCATARSQGKSNKAAARRSSTSEVVSARCF